MRRFVCNSEMSVLQHLASMFECDVRDLPRRIMHMKDPVPQVGLWFWDEDVDWYPAYWDALYFIRYKLLETPYGENIFDWAEQRLRQWKSDKEK